MDSPYLPHITDPFRIKIAVGYVQHELRKLFPNIKDPQTWQVLDQAVLDMAENKNPTLAPIRDFWNGVDGISQGFRLKNIVTRLTSLHYHWEEKNIGITDLTFGTTFEELDMFPAHITAEVVQQWYFDPKNKSQLAKALLAHKKRSSQTAPRDQFPLIVFQKDERILVSDGNRRLLQVILNQQPKVRVYLGKAIASPDIYEQWVPTSFFTNLVSINRYYSKTLPKITQSVAMVIACSIKDSQAGRYEFFQRSLHQNAEADLKLSQAVKSILQ